MEPVSLELASEVFYEFFAYVFGGEESRPSDLKTWIVEGIISRRARSRLGKNSASRKSNSISRDRERIWKRAQEIGLQRFASDFGAEFQNEHGRERCADGKHSGIAEVKFSREQLSMILAGNPRFSWATFQKERDRRWEGICMLGRRARKLEK